MWLWAFLTHWKDSWCGYEWRCLNKSCANHKHSKASKQVGTSKVLPWIPRYFKNHLLLVKLPSKKWNFKTCFSLETYSHKIKMLLIGRIENYFSNFPIQLGGPGVIVQCMKLYLTTKLKIIVVVDLESKFWPL
jgi:hypothetical protein